MLSRALDLSDDRYGRRAGLPFRMLEGELVVVNPRRRQVHVLNGTAARIWQLLESARSLSELVTELGEGGSYDVGEEQVAADVAAFLADLVANELVTVEPARSQAAAG